MSRQQLALDVFRSLPKSMRERMNLDNLQAIKGALTIKDRIELFYKRVSNEESELREYKRSLGFCGGRPSCMTHTGDRKNCAACRAYFREMRARAAAGETRPIQRSEYGRIRLLEKKLVAKRRTKRPS